MKQRIMTALLAGAIFVGIFLSGSLRLVQALLLLIGGVAAGEWARLLQLPSSQQRLLAPAVLVLSLLGWLFAPLATGLLLAAALVWLLAVPVWLWNYEKTQALPLGDRPLALLALLLPTAFLLAAELIYRRLGGPGTLTLFLIIWASDSVAYFTGRRYGKTPLAPHTSPKKTLEGLLGGLVGAGLLSFLFIAAFAPPLPKLDFLLLSLLAVLYGVLGDLWESVLKRRAGVKDSGRILPGHGGMFDRIDSWLAAFPLWALAFLFALPSSALS